MAPIEHRNVHGYPLSCCAAHGFPEGGCEQGHLCPERGVLPIMFASKTKPEPTKTTKPEEVPRALLPVWMLWVGVFLSCAFLAWVTL